jgi:hypothetical protein
MKLEQQPATIDGVRSIAQMLARIERANSENVTYVRSVPKVHMSKKARRKLREQQKQDTAAWIGSKQGEANESR